MSPIASAETLEHSPTQRDQHSGRLRQAYGSAAYKLQVFVINTRLCFQQTHNGERTHKHMTCIRMQHLWFSSLNPRDAYKCPAFRAGLSSLRFGFESCLALMSDAGCRVQPQMEHVDQVLGTSCCFKISQFIVLYCNSTWLVLEF